MKMGAERRTGNHKGCPYEWFAGGIFRGMTENQIVNAA